MAKIQGPDGQVANVDDENRLAVFAVTQNQDKHANVEGRYWSIFVSVTPAGINDKFFYLRNEGTKDLVITDVRVSSSVVTQLLYKKVLGTTVGGTAVTEITNRKLGLPTVPDATIEQGADITGLTDDGVLFPEECDVANRQRHLKISSGIIIPQGQAVAFERIAATGLITMLVSLAVAE